MRVSFGSTPAPRGVTTLLAVGQLEDDHAPATDRAVKLGTVIAAGTFAVGLLFGSRTLRGLGAGGTLALLAVRAAARR